MDPNEKLFLNSIVNGDINSVYNLLNSGINPNNILANNQTALITAIIYNDYNKLNPNFIKIVELLINYGADVNAFSKNGSALMWAISTKNIDMIKLLISRGADPSAPDPSDGRTAMDNAKGWDELVEFLRPLSKRKNRSDDYQPSKRQQRFGKKSNRVNSDIIYLRSI
jgi:ankyrin repeat protein